MPRGRHRHSPPLHRLLPPSAIAGVSLVCALGPWAFSEPLVLRGLAAVAAVTAVAGAFVMRRWDIQAGKQVAELNRARASDEWRFEERVAELESDLDESRELRGKLEQRLRAKRAELAGLRNEHAALLRRYATAETERASALEGRRLLEIETTVPSLALPPARSAQDAPAADGTGGVEDTETADGIEDIDKVDNAEDSESEAPGGGAAETAGTDSETGETGETDETDDAAGDEPEAPAVFSPEGSTLFRRARAALARFGSDADAAEPEKRTAPVEPAAPAEPVSVEESAGAEPPARASVAETGGDAEAAREDEAKGKPEAADEHTRAAAPHPAVGQSGSPAEPTTAEKAAARPQDTEAPAASADADPATAAATAAADVPDASDGTDAEAALPRSEAGQPVEHAASEAEVPGAAPDAGARETGAPEAGTPEVSHAEADSLEAGSPEAGAPEVSRAEADSLEAGSPEAGAPEVSRAEADSSEADSPESVVTEAALASDTGALVPRPAGPVQPPSGHFTVPTAVAVVPAAQPVRPPAAEGGFDFFGTKKSSTPEEPDAVHNEDLADVVGQEAIVLHKAEAEAEFKPADEESRGIGQVIDLTPHDETEQIDLQGLRSAVS
ncbi:hypothetical protein [Streptomyces sp. NPDC088812]|uniref:hypothetical protein n=1 Tax=Streptomyces sp. NPDC088812 TaxID=3365905 RepID=UPI0037F86C49